MIKLIELEGYRLLDGFNADLGQLTAVIGANATGKSSLMDCLQLIRGSMEFPLRDVLAWQGGLASVLNAVRQTDKLTWKLTFQKPIGHPVLSVAPLKDDIVYVYEVEIGRESYDEPVPYREVVRTDKPYGEHIEPFKLLEATRHRSQIYSYQHRGLVPFDEAVSEGIPSLFRPLDEDNRDRSADKLPEPPEASKQERTLRLAQMKFFKEYPVLSWIRFLIASFSFYPGFDVTHFSKLRTQPAEIKPLTSLLPNGENLGTVLHEMLTRADFISAANELRDFLRTAYPSFDDIFAETAYGTPAKVLVRLREKGMKRSMELWDLSDGTLRFLCLAAALLNPVPPVFAAIDEPEAGFHPRLLPIIADMIKVASEKTQVLISTHSPDLLNYFSLDNVAVMEREENRINWKRPGTRESLKKMLESVEGETLGDLHRSGELEAL